MGFQSNGTFICVSEKWAIRTIGSPLVYNLGHTINTTYYSETKVNLLNKEKEKVTQVLHNNKHNISWKTEISDVNLKQTLLRTFEKRSSLQFFFQHLEMTQ